MSLWFEIPLRSEHPMRFWVSNFPILIGNVRIRSWNSVPSIHRPMRIFSLRKRRVRSKISTGKSWVFAAFYSESVQSSYLKNDKKNWKWRKNVKISEEPGNFRFQKYLFFVDCFGSYCHHYIICFVVLNTTHAYLHTRSLTHVRSFHMMITAYCICASTCECIGDSSILYMWC